MKKVLVGFDGSQDAMRAARAGAEWAAREEAMLLVANVIPYPIAQGDLPSGALVDMQEELRRTAQKTLQVLVSELKPLPVKIQPFVLEGSPQKELLRLAAEDPDVALVVVGRSGKGAMARAFLGSVSSRLAHACPRPLLIIP